MTYDKFLEETNLINAKYEQERQSLADKYTQEVQKLSEKKMQMLLSSLKNTRRLRKKKW